jgi:hypothetical protein
MLQVNAHLHVSGVHICMKWGQLPAKFVGCTNIFQLDARIFQVNDHLNLNGVHICMKWGYLSAKFVGCIPHLG